MSCRCNTNTNFVLVNKDMTPIQFVQSFIVELFTQFPPHTRFGKKLFPLIDDEENLPIHTSVDEEIGLINGYTYSLNYNDNDYSDYSPSYIHCKETNKLYDFRHINKLYKDQELIKYILHRKDKDFLNEGKFTKAFFSVFSNLVFGELYNQPGVHLYNLLTMFPPNSLEGNVLYERVSFAKELADKRTTNIHSIYNNGSEFKIERRDDKIFVTDYDDATDDSYQVIFSLDNLYDEKYNIVWMKYMEKNLNIFTKKSDGKFDGLKCIHFIIKPDDIGTIVYRTNTPHGIVSFYDNGIIRIEESSTNTLYGKLIFNEGNMHNNVFLLENIIFKFMAGKNTQFSYSMDITCKDIKIIKIDTGIMIHFNPTLQLKVPVCKIMKEIKEGKHSKITQKFLDSRLSVSCFVEKYENIALYL